MGHLDSQRSLPVLGSERSGFSPVAKKLRLSPEHRVVVLNAPEGYVAQLHPGPSDVRTLLEQQEVCDVVQLFVRDAEELRRFGREAVKALKPNGLLWITYPSGGQGGGATDLPATAWWMRRDVLGELTSETGYKPVAFVAIDDQWTAVRFKRT
ncbi:MAG TPA: hypothetical protein VMW11_09970 [Candidatus Dormibacteraeota bacterium]|nr:hypothetical protein [Candidatus Dormibacteraeota bacterium]